jgi:hypothetical protein
MADAEKKKSKITEAVEALSAVDSLNAAMVVQGAFIPDQTTITFDYKYNDSDVSDENPLYTYVALWVASKSVWYLSGVTSGVIRQTMDNTDLAKILASSKTVSATTLVRGDDFK